MITCYDMSPRFYFPFYSWRFKTVFVDKVMSLLSNMLSRLVITFLPRSRHLLIPWLQSPSAVILELKNIKSATVSPSICHEVMGPDVMTLVFWMFSFKSNFSLSSFTFIKRLFSSSSLCAIKVLSYAYLRLLIFLPAMLIAAFISSSPAFLMMYSVYKLNKQGDKIQPCLAFFVVMLPKAHLTSHSRKSGSRWLTTPSWLSGSWRYFLYSSKYSSHLFLISYASVKSIPFLSFIEPIFAWSVPLVSLIFLKRSLVFPILLFSSISLHWLLRKAFLSLLAVLWNSAFKWVYPSFSPLLFTYLLFTAIWKASSDSHFSFVHFFFLEMVLITVSCTVSWTSVHISSGTLSIKCSPLNLFLTSTV